MIHRFRVVSVCAGLILLLVWTVTAGFTAEATEFIWMEGENPTSANVEVQRSGWGNVQYLSEEKCLHCSIDAGKVESQVPGDDVSLKYQFQAPKNAECQVWSRIGMEFVRSPFDWRIDDGPWKRVTPDDLPTERS